MDEYIKPVLNKIKLSLFKGTDRPYFLLKVDLASKKFRISVNFPHLNKKYGLKINIKRNLNSQKFLLLLKKSNKALEINEPKILIKDVKAWHFVDDENSTELFFFERGGSGILVFFSLEYWCIEDFFGILGDI